TTTARLCVNQRRRREQISELQWCLRKRCSRQQPPDRAHLTMDSDKDLKSSTSQPAVEDSEEEENEILEESPCGLWLKRREEVRCSCCDCCCFCHGLNAFSIYSSRLSRAIYRE